MYHPRVRVTWLLSYILEKIEIFVNVLETLNFRTNYPLKNDQVKKRLSSKGKSVSHL